MKVPVTTAICPLSKLVTTIKTKAMQATITHYDGHIQEILNDLPVTVIRKITVKTHRLPSGSWETIYYTNGRPSGSCTSKDRKYNLSEIMEEIATIGYTLTPYTGAASDTHRLPFPEVSETAIAS